MFSTIDKILHYCLEYLACTFHFALVALKWVGNFIDDHEGGFFGSCVIVFWAGVILLCFSFEYDWYGVCDRRPIQEWYNVSETVEPLCQHDKGGWVNPAIEPPSEPLRQIDRGKVKGIDQDSSEYKLAVKEDGKLWRVYAGPEFKEYVAGLTLGSIVDMLLKRRGAINSSSFDLVQVHE